MTIDRGRIIEGVRRARVILNHPDLPWEAKAAAKRAIDHGEAALMLDAMKPKPAPA